MQIDWWTLALQAVNFLVLVWLLSRFLYRPVKEVIEKRKRLAEQAFAEADKQKSAAEAERRHLEAEKAALIHERQALLNKTHEELEAERAQVLDEARRKADEMMEAARQALAEERDATLADMRDQIAGLAVALAADLLCKAEPDAPNGVFLRDLERQLESLPAEERARLQADLAADDAQLKVVTASPLPADERDRWTERLNACVGHKDATVFATDPDILGGAELHFPHAVIRFTWADQLRKAGDVLKADEAAS